MALGEMKQRKLPCMPKNSNSNCVKLVALVHMNGFVHYIA